MEANSTLEKSNKENDCPTEDPFGETSRGNLKCVCFLRILMGRFALPAVKIY